MLSWKIRDLKPCDDARNVYYLIDAFDVSLYGTRTKGMTSTFHHVPMFVVTPHKSHKAPKKSLMFFRFTRLPFILLSCSSCSSGVRGMHRRKNLNNMTDAERMSLSKDGIVDSPFSWRVLVRHRLNNARQSSTKSSEQRRVRPKSRP